MEKKKLEQWKRGKWKKGIIKMVAKKRGWKEKRKIKKKVWKTWEWKVEWNKQNNERVWEMNEKRENKC